MILTYSKGQNPAEGYHVSTRLEENSIAPEVLVTIDLFHLNRHLFNQTLLRYPCFNTSHVHISIMCIRA